MKKFIIFVLTVVVVASMAIPAYAVTPSIGMPDMPEIPDISDDIKFELPSGFWQRWFAEHPIKIPMFKLPSEDLLNRLQGVFE